MRPIYILLLSLVAVVLAIGAVVLVFPGAEPAAQPGTGAATGEPGEPSPLPRPRVDASDLMRAIEGRRSVRAYGPRPLEPAELADLLWAAGGRPVDAVATVTRTAPSAGATDPLVVYAAVGMVSGLPAGLYRYEPLGHGLVLIDRRDLRATLAAAALGQEAVAEAPAVIIIAADFARTTDRYGERGHRYVHIEVGHAAQNAALVAHHLGLGSVMIGAFDDARVRAILGPGGPAPLMLIPVGPR